MRFPVAELLHINIVHVVYIPVTVYSCVTMNEREADSSGL